MRIKSAYVCFSDLSTYVMMQDVGRKQVFAAAAVALSAA